MGIPDHLTASLEISMQAKKQQLEPDMEQQTGSKLWLIPTPLQKHAWDKEA